jgi:hypothetical protein
MRAKDYRFPLIAMFGKPQSQSERPTKPPRRHWQATHSFADIRLSHVIEGALALALFAAATAQVYVYIRQASIMDGQLTVMRDTLGEMSKQRLLTIAQMRANLRREDPEITPMNERSTPAVQGEKADSWQISPRWTDAGSTNAQEYLGWFDVQAFDRRPNQMLDAKDCPAIPTPPDLPDGTVIPPGHKFPQLAQKLSAQDAFAAVNGGKYILMRGHIQYRDIFQDTSLHYENWCVVIIPNDAQRSIFSFPLLRDSAG